MRSAFLFILLIASQVNAAEFSFKSELSEVIAYAGNSSYSYKHCIIKFDQAMPTACPNKSVGVIYLGNSVGEMMCSFALTAYTTGQSVDVSGLGDCDSIHSAPIIRLIKLSK